MQKKEEVSHPRNIELESKRIPREVRLYSTWIDCPSFLSFKICTVPSKREAKPLSGRFDCISGDPVDESISGVIDQAKARRDQGDQECLPTSFFKSRSHRFPNTLSRKCGLHTYGSYEHRTRTISVRPRSTMRRIIYPLDEITRTGSILR
ncbi:hypothetical protein BCR43DRAFT_490375 [Syncephalastrum racemosum]|uniref:Uncharacterized protein n=1 Tax=Syncephalastrum racemosum TaxID=13706 RepID=A0A1X2HH65_SYNRA|nr:hypothetical protein BCR43DRAFT_490375 [Syncephalastrum racemosum]